MDIKSFMTFTKILGSKFIKKNIFLKNIVKLISFLITKFEKAISSIVSHNIVVTDFLQKKFPNSTTIHNYPLSKNKNADFISKDQMCYIGNLDLSRGVEVMSRLALDMKISIILAGNASEDSLKIINNNQYMDYRGFLDQKNIREIMLNSKIGFNTPRSKR